MWHWRMVCEVKHAVQPYPLWNNSPLTPPSWPPLCTPISAPPLSFLSQRLIAAPWLFFFHGWNQLHLMVSIRAEKLTSTSACPDAEFSRPNPEATAAPYQARDACFWRITIRKHETSAFNWRGDLYHSPTHVLFKYTHTHTHNWLLKFHCLVHYLWMRLSGLSVRW